MSFEHYVRSGTDRLRMGYTTGTCAALAASAAVRVLLTGSEPAQVSLRTPKGIPVVVPVSACERTRDAVMCAVQKDSGDDPDITNGCTVRARVTLSEEGITIDGGEGVGRITKPGLDRPVGDAAINTVPRRMIADAVEAVCTEEGYEGGVHVVISVPGGAELAKKTFNPALGVEGGISILGTSGIVEPMSMQALVDTIELEIRQAAETGATRLVLTPGNIGEAFWKTLGVNAEAIPVVRCSNFTGEALDAACLHGIREILVAGHAGKLVKLAGGIMQTHSRTADCRMELFVAHAALCGASKEVCEKLMNCVTTDACLAVLEDAKGAGSTGTLFTNPEQKAPAEAMADSLADAVMESLARAVDRHLEHRVTEGVRAGAVLFSKDAERVTYTRAAEKLLSEWKGADA